MAQAVSHAVVRFVRYWTSRAEMLLRRPLARVGDPTSKFGAWEGRLGKANQHNATLPRQHWLRSWERRVIPDYQADHPDVGYRQLTYMMLDADVVAAGLAVSWADIERFHFTLSHDNHRLRMPGASPRQERTGHTRRPLIQLAHHNATLTCRGTYQDLAYSRQQKQQVPGSTPAPVAV